jgi:hypothetical protein
MYALRHVGRRVGELQEHNLRVGGG